jgi:ABC-type glycerol-3-phosphate transport system substrate-binding protein
MKGNFKIILLIVFIAGAVFSVFVFSGAIPIGKKSSQNVKKVELTLWGTTKPDDISNPLDRFNASDDFVEIKYVQKDAENFDLELLEAIATGKGPDLFFLTDDIAYKYTNKIYVVPYASYPLVTYKNTFVDAGDVFLSSEGVLAFPVSVDPLMMYYNKSMLDANNIVYPPKYWDELLALLPVLNQKDETKKLTKSTVALGQYSNVNNAKDIVATLFMQASNPIVEKRVDKYYSALTRNDSSILGSVLSFYTNFANPIETSYSWNRLLPTSRDYFTANNLAFYFGFASELGNLTDINPNLNFLLAPVPQVKGSNFKVTFAHVSGISVLNSSKNLQEAIYAAGALSSGDFGSDYAKATRVASARLDILAQKPLDIYSPSIYASALYSKSWLDPSPRDTNLVFRAMIEGVLSNNISPQGAIAEASERINFLLSK